MASIGGLNIEDVEAELAGSLAKLITDKGSQSATVSLLALLKEVRLRSASAEHALKMGTLEGAELLEYLGLCGTSAIDAKELVGHPLSSADIAALQRGARKRLLEARAIDVARMRLGEKTEPWLRNVSNIRQ